MHIFVTTEAPSASSKGAAFADALRTLPSHSKQAPADSVLVVSCLKYKLACLSRATGVELTEYHYRNNEPLPPIRPEARESNVGWIPVDFKTEHKDFARVSEEFPFVWEQFLKIHDGAAAQVTVLQAIGMLGDAANYATYEGGHLYFFWTVFLLDQIEAYRAASTDPNGPRALVLTDATTADDVEACCRNCAYWVHFSGEEVVRTSGYRMTIDATNISIKRAAEFADYKYEHLGRDHPSYTSETAKRHCENCGREMMDLKVSICGSCLMDEIEDVPI